MGLAWEGSRNWEEAAQGRVGGGCRQPSAARTELGEGAPGRGPPSREAWLVLPWPLVLGGPWGLLGAAVQSQDQAPGLAGSVDSGLLGAEAVTM